MRHWCSNTSSASPSRRPSCSRPSACAKACSTKCCRRPSTPRTDCSARHAQELIGWTDRLVRVTKLRETEEERRLRHAACLLSDIGWRVHPDHRGEQTMSLITNGNFGAVTHQGRAFLALAVFYRYAGLGEQNEPPAMIHALVPPSMVERARVLGAAFRVAHLISAARPGVLPAIHFRSQGRKLMLLFEHRMVDLVADRVGSRFKQLARLVGRTGTIVRR